MPRSSRKATHSGSWYSDTEEELVHQIRQWMSVVPDEKQPHARVVISPHAGFRFCGHIMAFAFKHVRVETVKRVFILGPSHHHYTPDCLLTMVQHYDTPFGKLAVDSETVTRLLESGKFGTMSLSIDQAEHSLEMQLPYIAYLFSERDVKIVPILVGALSSDREVGYGEVLAPYLDDPSNLFVISSDFCHWGSRFNYTFHNPGHGQIFQSIQWLDGQAMSILEEGDAAAFREYLQEYQNTICGRHPIAVLLSMMERCKSKIKLKMQQYDQSTKCRTRADSSVSYVAAIGVESL